MALTSSRRFIRGRSLHWRLDSVPRRPPPFRGGVAGTSEVESMPRPVGRSKGLGRHWGPFSATNPARLGPMTALEADLRRRVRGAVRFDAGSRALFAAGGSLYRQVPVGVVIPEDADAVAEAVAVCRDHDAAVLPMGADTSLAGQSTNVAVVIDFSPRLNRILELDAGARRARVQPGVILDHLRDAAERHQLTFGPDPATHAWCSLGGMIGNNACGVHSIMAGKTDENVESLEVLTYDGTHLTVGATSEDEIAAIVAGRGRRGEIYGRLRDLRDRYAELVRARYPRIPRRVSGYNLDQLLPENGFHVARAL